MEARIDNVTLEIVAYEDEGGHRIVRFAVPLPDDEFVAVVRRKWEEYASRLLVDAQKTGAQDFGPLFS